LAFAASVSHVLKGTEIMTMLEGNQAALFAERQKGTLPGELGIEWTDVSTGHASGGFTVAKIHMAANGFLHGGRMTQVWDAEATNATTGKVMAVFRCTQMVLYPR